MRTSIVVGALIALAFVTPFLFPLPPSPPAASVQSAAAAAPKDALQYDTRSADTRTMMDQSEAGLESCFDRAMRGFMRMGNRDRDQVIGFATNSCSQGYRKLMMMAGASDEASTAYINLVASQHLDYILHTQ